MNPDSLSKSFVRRAGRVAGFAILLISLSAPVVASPAVKHPLSRTAQTRATIIAFADLFYRQKKVRAAFERYVSKDYIQHNPDFPDGRDGPIEGVQKLFAPQARLEIKRVVVEGDLAVLHILARLKPGERGLAVVDIYRLAGGKIVEHWDVVQPIPGHASNPHPMF